MSHVFKLIGRQWGFNAILKPSKQFLILYLDLSNLWVRNHWWKQFLYWTQSCWAGKGRYQGLTLLLRLWSAQKRNLSWLPSERPNKHLKRVRCRYLHPTNGKKQMTPVVELRKVKRSWGEGQSYRRTSSLNLDSHDFSYTGLPKRQHTPANMKPPTHIQ